MAVPPFLHLSVVEVLEVAVVFEVHVIVREQEVIKLCAIVIGHGCHIVDDNLVRLGRLEVRLLRLIMVICDEVDMVLDTLFFFVIP